MPDCATGIAGGDAPAESIAMTCGACVVAGNRNPLSIEKRNVPSAVRRAPYSLKPMHWMLPQLRYAGASAWPVARSMRCVVTL